MKIDLKDVRKISLEESADFLQTLNTGLDRLTLLNGVLDISLAACFRFASKTYYNPEDLIFGYNYKGQTIPFSIGGMENLYFPALPFYEELDFNVKYKKLIPELNEVLVIPETLQHQFPIIERIYPTFNDYLGAKCKTYRTFFIGAKSKKVKWDYCLDDSPLFRIIPAKCHRYWVQNCTNLRERFIEEQCNKQDILATYAGFNSWLYGKQFLVYATDVETNEIICCMYNTIIGNIVSSCCIAHTLDPEYKKYSLVICANLYTANVVFYGEKDRDIFGHIEKVDLGINHTDAGDYKIPYITSSCPMYNFDNFTEEDVKHLLELEV